MTEHNGDGWILDGFDIDRVEAEELAALRADGTINAKALFDRIVHAKGMDGIEEEIRYKAKELTALRAEIAELRDILADVAIVDSQKGQS